MRVTWIQPEDLVRHEFHQQRDEGAPAADLEQQWLAAGGGLEPPSRGASEPPAPPALRRLAAELLAELDSRVVPGDAEEPATLDAIFAAAAPVPSLPGRGTDYAERIHGAWLGRAAGCLLGKPVEKIPRDGIRAILESTGRWPLRGYFTAAGLADDVAARWPWNRASAGTSLAENIRGMPEDDDLNYTLLALKLTEQHGDELTSADVAGSWLLDLPAGRTFTAERTAYRNLLVGDVPPASALHANPYREWIGAAIRTDLYGWTHPGDPRAAAALAFADASVSHTRNGLYGAMYVAALGSAAVVGADIETVLDAGMSVIPAGSRLARAVEAARNLTIEDTEAAIDELYSAHKGRHWVHVLNNVALSTYALTASAGEFVPAICTVVSGGWDTDSNGATCGAVAGALAGAAALPSDWIAPLRNQLRSSIPGFDGARFDELAARTVAVSAQ